jgi:hypothetical protein
MAFDTSLHMNKSNILDFNLVKKLLTFLQTLEKSEGLAKFIKNKRTYTTSLSFLPSNDLLGQIISFEGLSRFLGHKKI